jgi:hypothetical protein
MNHPERFSGEFVHTASVRGNNDLAEKLIHSEEALTSKDIEEYSEAIVSNLKKIVEQARAQNKPIEDYVIIDLVQEEILKRFKDEFFSNKEMVDDFLDRVVDRILVVYLKEKYPDRNLSVDDIDNYLEKDADFAEYNKNVEDQTTRNYSWKNNINDPEYRQGVAKIQQLVLKHLRKRLVKERIPEVMVALNMAEKSIQNDSPHIVVTRDLYGNKHVLRRDRMADSVDPWTSPEDMPNYDRALQISLKMPRSKHILPYEYYDKENRTAKVEFVENLGNLYDELYGRKKTLSPIEILKVLRDNILGAIDYEKAGLGTMDVSLSNIGFTKKEGEEVNGMLPDPEGVYPLNEIRTDRIFNGSESAKPDGTDSKLDYWPPEIKPHEPVKFTSREVVFQFGVCLNFIVGKLESKLIEEISDESRAEQVIIDLHMLVKQMTFFDENEPRSAGDRPPLTTVERQLSLIIDEIKNALSKNEQEPIRLAA